MANIVIIDYGSGNLRSAEKALAKAGGTVTVTNKATALNEASHIVLPGVGAFADCMAGLSALPGMRDALEKAVLEHKKPFLGICVGMQMLMEKGFEHGEHQGLGWLKGSVIPLADSRKNLKIPHMGWNDLDIQQNHPLLKGVATRDHAYFVHSYHVLLQDPEQLLATVDYGGPVAAVIAQGNIMGTQFHPEKSQAAGIRILQNFIGIS